MKNTNTIQLLLWCVFMAGVFWAGEIENACVRTIAMIGTFAAWSVSLYLIWPRKEQPRRTEQ